ncbi:MAG TPA: lysylphosphatidylglycerol synthase transmembrane domain-containing protein [Gaiellaceae bacterium]|nr:lysylphosphatidylglycerol synthase transmembrane domain-containing protein [Gaiellaceae bacterium]
MGAFFHAVGIFIHHLRQVEWTPLGLALACHVTKLLFRARAWQNIIRAAYPNLKLRYRSALGAYTAGVGVNSIAPARGGDLIKLYLVKHRMKEATYPTLTSTLIVETMFDFVVAGCLMIWALSIGVLPTHQVYSRIPTVDWKFFLKHETATGIGLAVIALVLLLLALAARRRVEDFWGRVRLGFAILGNRRTFVLGVLVPQAISWVFRIATLFFFLRAFRVDATVHNALLAQVVDSLSTLFPATPGGAGTKQGLIVYLFRRSAISRTLLLAFSVGMNIAITVTNLVLGVIALALMARTLSFGTLRSRARADEQTVES